MNHSSCVHYLQVVVCYFLYHKFNYISLCFAFIIIGLPFADMVRVSMYDMELKKQRGVNADMFQLNEKQRNLVKKALALPKVTSWIRQCIAENNFDENGRLAYQKQLSLNNVTDIEWRATSIDFYYQECQKVAKDRAVPTNNDMERLKKLVTFLDCSIDSVNKVNLELFGDKYVKAVTESMTPTGVITEEYLDGLERLRQRLGEYKTMFIITLSTLSNYDLFWF